MSDFEKYYKSYSKEDLKKVIDLSYQSLFNSFNNEIHFGKAQCKDFLGSIILLRFDKSVDKNIGYILCMIFDGKCECENLSEYMYYVVENSKISITEWISALKYFEKHHSWIETHECV